VSAERRARRRAILRAARRADRDRRLRRDLVRLLSSAPIREWLDAYAMPVRLYWGPWQPEPRERLTVTGPTAPESAVWRMS
jgi:hypothetical protein